MPVETHKMPNGRYMNRTPGGVKGKNMTKENAEDQERLLNALDHGWKPSKGSYRKRMREMK